MGEGGIEVRGICNDRALEMGLQEGPAAEQTIFIVDTKIDTDSTDFNDLH